MTSTYGATEQTPNRPSVAQVTSLDLYDADEDEEYEYLPLPEVDEDFLDEDVAATESGRKELQRRLPFSRIHEAPQSLYSGDQACFMPGQRITVQIFKIDQSEHLQLLNRNLYMIKVVHGDYEWNLCRRFKHFRSLHDSLWLLRQKAKIPMPTKSARERRKSFAKQKRVVPRFPKTPDSLVRTDNLERRRQQLEAYLQAVLKCPMYRNHPEMLKFLEVSHLSFVAGLGAKLKEGMVEKRAGGRRVALHCCFCCTCCQLGHWQKRYLMLKDSFVAYVHPEEGTVSDVLLMDEDFSVQTGIKATGVRNGLLVSNLSRHLLLKCWTQRKTTEWYEAIQSLMNGPSGKDYIEHNRYDSFAPVRPNSYVNWFVDGASYMAAVADALEAAKEEIFITDWMLSPEVYLKRPALQGDRWRLDKILARKAHEGVQIFILIYKEMEIAVGINSLYTKTKLTKLHRNIKVMRHPDGIKLWSHHEKCVVIDQRLAFLGGIDLCYGRWDTRSHRLTDLAQMKLTTFYGEDDNATLQNVLHNVPVIVPRLLKLATDNNNVVDGANITQVLATASHPHQSELPSITEDDDPSKATVDSISVTVKPDMHGAYINPVVTENPNPDELVENSKSTKTKMAKQLVRQNNTIDEEDFKSAKNPDSGELDGGKASQQNMSPSSPQEDALDKSTLRTFLRMVSMQSMDVTDRLQSTEAPNEQQSPPERQNSVRHDVSRDQTDAALPPQSLLTEEEKAEMFLSKAVAAKQQTPSRKHQAMRKATTSFAMLFQRSTTSMVDVTDDSVDRPWDHSVYVEKERGNDKFDAQLASEGLCGPSKIWIGKDYVNFICKDFCDLDNPFSDLIDRTVTPRLPWHDIHSAVFGKSARDVARHFIQRWNFTKLEKKKTDAEIPMLLPKSNSVVFVPNWATSSSFCCNTQILRSSCDWSAGIKHVEASIHNAYIDLIRTARHYIYIENQFFVSVHGDNVVENKISSALYDRIIQAHRAGENFRVYVMLPLLPAFEGEIGTDTGTAIQAVIHWNYSSICRGGRSLLERLVLAGVSDPFNYITFFGLRKHEEMCGRLTTELIYVHSKLMIVDDFSVIIASANINDRSMLGSRDSELGILVQDTCTVESRMDGKRFQAGAFACSLRKSLFREHLRVSAEDEYCDVADPVDVNFYKNVWLRQASINTTVYDKVFSCVPTDETLTLRQLREHQNRPVLATNSPADAQVLLDKVKGHLVLLPLQFLSSENLSPAAGTKEALVPKVLWT